MPASLNLHKVFAGEGGYLQDLRVPASDDTTLRRAREKIRDTLRGAFRDWDQHVSRAELFDSTVAKSLAEIRLPQPKFRLQGSFAYHTVNDCQQTPPQQIDQDDGVFLPIGFLVSQGGVRPAIASKAYFKLVEEALGPLCAQEGWTLNPKRKKDTCVRIGLGERMHIDLPLYAIQDEAFERLVETEIAKAHTGRVAADAQTDLFEDVYRGLADTEIMLAHREHDWLGSDPRKLEDWFKSAVDFHGPQVRRLARAYKAMRDAEWASSGLSSICIMAALVTALENIESQEEARDDLALMNTALEMVEIFKAPIENPVFPGDDEKCLCQGWSTEFRSDVQALFQRAADELNAAINGTLNRSIALAHVRTAFGSRVPDNTDLISTVGLVSVIRAEPAQPRPQPMPVRTKSG